MQLTRAVLARFAEVTLIPVLHEASQPRAVIFTDRFKAERMSFVYRHCTNTTGKCQSSRFVEDVNKPWLNFLSVPEL